MREMKRGHKFAASVLDHMDMNTDNAYGFRRCCGAVREAVPVEQIAQRYTDLEIFGGKAWFVGRCPLPDHDDETPSFYIYPLGRWWCYGCGRGGDAIDLEFFCGEYGELWEAMIALAMEHNVELPERPESWRRKNERQEFVRNGIDAAKVYAARRRIYRGLFEPLILAIEDTGDRDHDAQLFWEATAPLAEHLVANMMGRQR